MRNTAFALLASPSLAAARDADGEEIDRHPTRDEPIT